jgi:hypothetical protein
MHAAHLELTKSQVMTITTSLEQDKGSVVDTFNSACDRVLKREGIEGHRPPYELNIGLGGLSAKLHYWRADPGEV